MDIGQWERQMRELKTKIPEKIMYMSKHDILRYARINILGVTEP